ncbi:OSJNBa0032F06.19 protein, related, partial [Eimeria necatrix]
VAGMSAEEAAVFIRPPPKRYKSHAKTKAKVRITSLVRQAAVVNKDLRAPLHGLHLILALPEACSAVPLRLSDEWQGALYCALIGSQPTSSGCLSPLASTASVTAGSDEESPWPMAKLEHTLFDEWINSTEAQDIPCEVAQAAVVNKDLRAPLHGLHLILALPEACSAVPLRLSDESQGALYCALIGSQPTSSGCESALASTASVTAGSDEESPWPMAKLEHTLFDEWINSTEAQDIPCEVAQVLHEYRAVFPDTLPKGLPSKRPHDHHILLAPGKLPARSAIYRMTPDQLTFHKQEIAKLSDNVWIGPTYSPICSPTIMVDKRDDGSGERKMRLVVNYQALNALTIAPDFPLPPIQTIVELLGGAKYFSTLDFEAGFHQIRIAKEDRWKTAFRSVLGLFEYRVMPCGLKEDKIEAIRHWPEVLENETQVRQFLATINYCRMFMGPDCADVARPLVDVTRKDVSFKWTELHTQTVRQLKQRLIDFTTLQVPDTTKPFELYTDASGYAVGGVLEQDGKPIGFLSQVMKPTQQRYSIYDQELLALVTALHKWSHLLRVSKVTAFTDHQALTHLQLLQASKPLRGRTARWLDVLAEFPGLHITNPTQSRNLLHLQRRHPLVPLTGAIGRKRTRSVLLFEFPTKPQQANQEKLCRSSSVIANLPFAT